jgi:uncharacterized membrane protein
MFLSAVILVLLDSIYLKLISGFFNKQVKAVQGSKLQLNLTAAVMTYILLILGLNYFIIQPKRSVTDAACLGFVIYGVYEFTNLSLLKNWLPLTAVIDTVWGATLFALTTAITYKLKKMM